MATVYIPTLLQALTGGRSSVRGGGRHGAAGDRQSGAACPGLRDRLVEQGRLRPNISVAVDGEVTPMGLLEPVESASEVHFVAAIKGGKAEVVNSPASQYNTAHFLENTH